MTDSNHSFEYTYSAPQQEEIKKICEKYRPKEPDKMEQLRKLDESASQKGMAVSLIVGVIGALILGVGMCCTMIWAGQWFVPGILIGIIGIFGVSMAYPLYISVTKREREKIAPEVLRLADELMR